MVFNHSFFDRLKDYWGREQYLAMTKGEISLLEICSKIEHLGVQKTLVEPFYGDFFFSKPQNWSLLVTTLKKGVQKMPRKGV